MLRQNIKTAQDVGVLSRLEKYICRFFYLQKLKLENRKGVCYMSDTANRLLGWVEFVNSQAAYHLRQIERIARRESDGKPELKRQKANHQRIAEQFQELADFLQTQRLDDSSSLEHSGPNVVSPALHLLPEDLEGLPKELLKELNISESDQLELEIFDSLKKAGGTLPVDKILIQLYRDTGQVHSRDKLAAKLYRMSAKGKLIASNEHRGVYSLPGKSDQAGSPESSNAVEGGANDDLARLV